MFGDGGLRPPVKLYPIVPPPLVSAAAVYGNEEDTGDVTERGKTFLITVINLLQGSFKMFGNEEEVPWDASIWPGLELETPQDKFQFIKYVGGNEKNQADWGDLSRVDFDFNGEADPGRKIEDGVPFALYQEIENNSSVVNYDDRWKEIRKNLSSINSFQQELEDNKPVTDEGMFDFVVGLVQARRSWIYGMTAIGINPVTPNAPGAKENFDKIFKSWKVQEGGALNIQVLQNYIGLRLTIAEKFNAIAKNPWLKEAAHQGAEKYLKSVKGDPNSVDSLFAELSSPLSQAKLAEDFIGLVGKSFYTALGKPIGFVAGIQGTNGMFRAMNKNNQRKYEREKEVKMLEKEEEMKAEMKHRSSRKAQEGQALKKAEAEKQNMRKISKKGR